MKTILFNPFQKYSEKQLFLFGWLLTILASSLSLFFNGRFDGVIDLHFVEKTSFITASLDFVICIGILTLLLFITGKMINKKTRFIDILVASLIAKIPFYFLLFFNINNKMFIITQKLMDTISQKKELNIETLDMSLIVFSAIATFICMIWSMILLFNGFKTATNIKETKHILLFILSVIIAEVLSKIILFKLN
ncbi:YIP1 family protein [Flavobacterium sp.]|uniref:YIP1 family protein n=1 Tax=Flavobacterium sp. TaxID=239 RepID=UPI0037520BC4